MTLTGEVVELVEPPSRSPWAEPNPEHDDLEHDDPGAVAEAAAEAITADLNAELAEIARDADGHMFSVLVNRRTMPSLSHLTPTERLVFVGHALAMGPAPAHHWPLESVGALVGVTRESATRATAKLVNLGVLHRKDRGRIDARTTRPAEFRFADEILESTTRVTDAHTGDEIQTESTTRVTNDHTGTRVTDGHTVESEKDLLPTTAKGRDRWVAPGARCDTCGGSVQTNPNTGQPNPQCKPCYRASQTEQATAEVVTLDHLGVMRALMGRGWGNRHTDRRSGPDRDELVRLFGGDEVAAKAAESLRYSFGMMTDREAAPAWRAAYLEAGGRP